MKKRLAIILAVTMFMSFNTVSYASVLQDNENKTDLQTDEVASEETNLPASSQVTLNEESNTLSNLRVSNTNPNLGERITFSFDFVSQKDIVDFQVSVKEGKSGPCNTGMQFRSGEKRGNIHFDFDWNIDFYGTYKIDYFYLTDADGKKIIYSDNSYDASGFKGSNDEYYKIDMSVAQATVRNDPNDTTAPVIKTNTLTVNKKSLGLNEEILIEFEVEESNGLANSFNTMKWGNSGLCSGNCTYDSSTHKCSIRLTASIAGKWEIVSLSVVDTSANTTTIYNSRYSGHAPDELPAEDLSRVDVTVTGGVSGDTKGPEFDIDSLTVSKKNIGLREYNTISIKVSDESTIFQVDPVIKEGKGGECSYGGGFQYNPETGYYDCIVQGLYYGLYEIAGISATDTNGNITYLSNSVYSGNSYNPEGYYGSATTHKKDLSAGSFYVGLADGNSGVFVAGDGFENGVSLGVDPLTQDGNSNIYNQLYENGFLVGGFWNIHMAGVYNNGGKKVWVCFPALIYKNGTVLRVRHLKSNGEIETLLATVHNGLAYIQVDSFSPFLIEYEEGSRSDTGTHVDPARVKAFVSRMYTVALSREAELAGLDDWSSQLINRKSDGATLARGFICSDEFKNKNMSNEQFVDILYHTFFDRDPDDGGKTDWLNKLSSGVSRESVLAGFVNSAEFGNLCDQFGIARGTMEENGSNIYNPGVRDFVLRNYEKALGRKGETAGVEDWSHRINTGQMSALDVAQSFFHSTEFLNKNTTNEEYVEILYETFLGRASEPAGKADWVGQLNNGADRDDVMKGFAYSQEFRDIMAKYGL